MDNFNFMHKPGDLVMIRGDLNKYGSYYMRDRKTGEKGTQNFANNEMIAAGGKAFQIDRIYLKQYLLKGIDFFWTDDMFCECSNEECYCESLL